MLFLILMKGKLDRYTADYYNYTSFCIKFNKYSKSRVKSEDLLPPEKKIKYMNKILDYVLYDVEDCQTLEHFEQIKTNTHCTFASLSKLWGAKDYDDSLTLETNVERSVQYR